MAKMYVAYNTSLKVVKYKALFYNVHNYKIVVKLMKYSIMNSSSKALLPKVRVHVQTNILILKYISKKQKGVLSQFGVLSLIRSIKFQSFLNKYPEKIEDAL